MTPLNMKIELAIKEELPAFKVVRKEDSKLMQAINVVMKRINPEFMTSYTTTFYPTVFAPEEHVRSAMFWKILAHEWVHLHHAKKQTSLVHSMLYGFPQILALLSLASVYSIWGSPWFLLNLLWLSFLAPIPAYFRMKEEMSAYAMSMACNYWKHGSIQEQQIDWLCEVFTGPGYYFMWPFKSNVKKRINKIADNIEAGKYDELHPFKTVKKLIQEDQP